MEIVLVPFNFLPYRGTLIEKIKVTERNSSLDMFVVFLCFFKNHSTLPRLQMRFYLHMSGDGIGTLSVLRRSRGGGDGLHPLLNLTGDQGNNWQMKEIPLSDSADFQVVFEGKVGPSPKGDICLDDITFSPGCLLAPAPLEEAHATSEASAGFELTRQSVLEV